MHTPLAVSPPCYEQIEYLIVLTEANTSSLLHHQHSNDDNQPEFSSKQSDEIFVLDMIKDAGGVAPYQQKATPNQRWNVCD